MKNSSSLNSVFRVVLHIVYAQLWFRFLKELLNSPDIIQTIVSTELPSQGSHAEVFLPLFL